MMHVKYTLNFYSAICQLYSIKVGKKKIKKKILKDWLKEMSQRVAQTSRRSCALPGTLSLVLEARLSQEK